MKVRLKAVFFAVLAFIVLLDVVLVMIGAPYIVWTPVDLLNQLTLDGIKQITQSLPLDHHGQSKDQLSHVIESATSPASNELSEAIPEKHQSTIQHVVHSIRENSDSSIESDSRSNTHSTTEEVLVHPANSNTPEAIKRDLERCSLAMGIPSPTLTEQEETVMQISQRASQFLETVHLLVPHTFSTHFRNPCWYYNLSSTSERIKNGVLFNFVFQSGRDKGVSSRLTQYFARNIFGDNDQQRHLLCLPSFFIAGFPKSATTTLDAAFRKHSQVVGPRQKEPHWWTRAEKLASGSDIDPDYAKLSVYAYLLMFSPLAERLTAPLGEDFITYDASQSTLWDSSFFVDHQDYCAMPAILSRVLPNARFIIIMRNPVTRLYSHFVWSCTFRYGNNFEEWPQKVKEMGNVSTQFHLQVVKVLKVFRECLQTRSLYECTNVLREECSPTAEQCGTINYRLTIGLYYVHLYKWLQFYPRKQFLFLRTEDLPVKPQEVMSQVTSFLELSAVSEDEVKQWFSKKANAQNETLSSGQFKMEERTQAMLEEFYQPYNEMLAQLIGDNRFLWADT